VCRKWNFFGGRETFAKSFPAPKPPSFQKLLREVKKNVLLVTISAANLLSQKFLKSEGGAGGREELFPKKFLSPPC